MKISTDKLIFYIFIFFYSILPDYFRIASIPVYSLFIIFILFYYFFFNKINVDFFKDAMYAIALFTITRFVGMIIHAETITLIRFFIEQFIFILVISALIYKHHNYENVAKAMVIFSGIVCMLGLVEYFTGFNVFSLIENYSYGTQTLGSIPYYRLGSIRIEQSFNHAISYSAFLLINIFVNFYVIEISKRKIYKFTLVLLFINLFLTKTRSVILILIFGLIILFFFDKKLKKKFNLKFYLFMFPLIIFVIILIISNEKINKIFIQYFYMLAAIFNDEYIGTIKGIDDPTVYRMGLFKEVLNVLKGNYLFGIGLSRTDIIKIPFYNLQHDVYIYNNSIDNTFLREFSKYGFVGVFGYVAFYIFFFIKSVVGYFKNKEIKFYKYFSIITLLYMMVLFTFPQMYEYRVYYILICIFICIQKNEKSVIKGENNGICCDSCL